MKGFLNDIYLRPSCYTCKCKNGVNHSDLTIADFWGINQVAQQFDDDKGVGLVLVNTEKGKDYFDKLPMTVLPSSLEVASRYNGGFNEHTNAHPKRQQFFALIDEGESVAMAVDACLRVPISRKVMRKMKRAVRKCIKLISR